jgi:hypothetical protein
VDGADVIGENVNSRFPWFKFFPADYLNDSQLAMAPLASQGLWTRAFCHSYRTPEPGKLIGSKDQLVRLLGCSREELDQFLQDASVLKFAEIIEREHGMIEIICRRMVRDQKAREEERQAAAERQRRRRGAVTQDVTGAVTQDVTGAVTQDVTGAVTPDVTRSDGQESDRDSESERDSKRKRERGRKTSPSRNFGSRKKPLKPLPEDLKLDEELRAFAASHGRLDPAYDFENFRQTALLNGWERADWRAAFKKFALTQHQFESKGQRPPLRSVGTAGQTAKPKLPQDLGRPGLRSTMQWGKRILGIVRDQSGAWCWDSDRDYDPDSEAAGAAREAVAAR